MIEQSNANETLDASHICRRVRLITLDIVNNGEEYTKDPLYASLQQIVTEIRHVVQYRSFEA